MGYWRRYRIFFSFCLPWTLFAQLACFILFNLYYNHNLFIKLCYVLLHSTSNTDTTDISTVYFFLYMLDLLTLPFIWYILFIIELSKYDMERFHTSFPITTVLGRVFLGTVVMLSLFLIH